MTGDFHFNEGLVINNYPVDTLQFLAQPYTNQEILSTLNLKKGDKIKVWYYQPSMGFNKIEAYQIKNLTNGKVLKQKSEGIPWDLRENRDEIIKYFYKIGMKPQTIVNYMHSTETDKNLTIEDIKQILQLP
ncbi:hypothetical protein [Bacillus sp. (in: firmicutes)]|uniref:hypothetical protein n=1 Tax=Bacillus sp. TaxID=1409 RepID=UPI0039E2C9EA